MAHQSNFLWKVGPPIVRGLARLGLSLKMELEAPVPPPPFVVAANHYSHLDPPVLGAVLDVPIRYLAVGDLFGANRMFTKLIDAFGAISTPRDVVPIGAVRAALRALSEDEVVAVFPEATRVSHWGVLPPKRGAAWLAARAAVPLIPAAILGTGRAMGLDNRLHRAPIRVVVGEPISPSATDVETMVRWAEWIGAQVSRFPELETTGPRRAFHEF